MLMCMIQLIRSMIVMEIVCIWCQIVVLYNDGTDLLVRDVSNESSFI